MTGQAPLRPLGAEIARRRAEKLGRHALRLDARGSLLAATRLVLATGIAASGGIAWWIPGSRPASTVVFAVLVGAFLVAARLHARNRERHLLAREVEEAARRDVIRVEGRWRELPGSGAGLAAPGRESDVADDLGLLGRGSIFQLASRCATPWGEKKLADLLLAAAPASDLALRQQAARALAGQGAFRRRLEGEGRAASEAVAGAASLAQQLARPSWLDGRPWIAPLGVLLALATLAQALVELGSDAPTAFWPSLLVNVAFIAWLSSHVLPEYEPLLDRQEPVLACAGMLRLLERRARGFELARRWREATSTPEPASAALHELGALLGALSLRRNAFWWPMQAFVLWDAWQAPRLARWRRRHGDRVSGWLEALADAETCSSFGGHAEAFGGCFAAIQEGASALEARGLAHPALAPGRAVANDVALTADRRVLLLTGSNMSGKSTLLRAVGANAVLALAGGPSAAESLRLRPCRVLTSIRVTDALDEGVSLFYAEVRRLKTVVQAVDDAARGDGLPVLFLVDEILRGTNARERHAAARAVVARLAASGSAGIVTSHDVELTALEETAPGVFNGHFREEIRDGRMTFDHRLRPGPVTTSNALAILRLEGIPVD